MGRIMVSDPNILDAAADWHANLEGDAPDYDRFAAWLEADARHRVAYDRVIALDTLLTDHAHELAPSLPANDDAPASARGGWRFAGIAAALALVVGVGSLSLRDTIARFLTQRVPSAPSHSQTEVPISRSSMMRLNPSPLSQAAIKFAILVPSLRLAE
jgi:ferric-dicitrate binding protein FerR (iron transport regulator)